MKQKCKKLLSVVLSAIMLITVVFCVPASAFASVTTNQSIIDNNTAELIYNLETYGYYDSEDDDYYINSSYSFTSDSDVEIEFFWYIAAENDGSLVFNMNYYEDGFWVNNTQMIVDSDKTAFVKLAFASDDNWEIGVHADMTNDYYHKNVYPKYVVDYCEYDDATYSEIRDTCDVFWCAAFEEWDAMLNDRFDMNMSCVGFYNYCSHSLKTSTTRATTSSDGKIVKKCYKCGYISTTSIARISTVKLSGTSYTYNGKVKTPTVTVKDRNGRTLLKNTDYTVSYASGRKNVGKYAVKVTFKGKYSGTKTLYFTIKPKATSIKSLSAGSKKFTVKWYKRTTQTTGYQVQYSTSSKFTSPKTVTISKTGTTSKTVKKLKAKKKYYVRVRTYKTVNGTRYYSSWSKYKKVTTKS